MSKVECWKDPKVLILSAKFFANAGQKSVETLFSLTELIFVKKNRKILKRQSFLIQVY